MSEAIKVVSEIDELRRQRDVLAAALLEVSGELRDHADVEDGDYDGPSPSWEMTLGGMVDDALDTAGVKR